MTATGKHRGHLMYFDKHEWRYSDNGNRVADCGRVCGVCEKPQTEQGHDPCIANLPGVQNACCGHGVVAEAYVQFEDLRGKSAVDFFESQKDN